MNKIKTISLYVVIAVLVTALSKGIESNFLHDFYTDELVPTLLTLLAINIANTTLIAQNIQKLKGYTKEGFRGTFLSLKISIILQVVLIGIAAVLLILLESDKVTASYEHASFAIEVLITSVFIAALDILRDTGTALFKSIEAAG